MTEARQRKELSREECLGLLGEVPVGRVVFTHRALPAIRPVNHLVEADQIIIRTSLGAAISSEPSLEGGTVVAYEADLIDAAERLGWSIVVVGRAGHVTDLAEVDRYRRALQPLSSAEGEDIIAIRADMVTGFRLLPVGPQAGPQAGPPAGSPEGPPDRGAPQASGPVR
jgi:nitroimidazol reductase NimA-like FMN-containing flavoprotein (pyridoxamine 5'-phosphate oxidase superfamily)